MRKPSILLLLLLSTASVRAQQPIPAGKGSYAAFPPPGIAKGKPAEFENKPLYLVPAADRPIPSNKWWTQLLVAKFARGLWSYPFKVDTSEKGLDVYFPIRWSAAGNDPQCDFPLTITGKDFTPADARAKDWSDWLVAFRLAESPEKFMDVTLGEGMPCLWIECRNLTPVLQVPPGVTLETFGKTGDGIGLAFKDRRFGVFGPDGTKFTVADNAVTVEFAGKSQFLVLAALPAEKDLEYFHRYAYAIPRDTKLSWQFDAPKGVVVTTWKITTDSLKGTGKEVIQGWIPHHYLKTTHNLAFNNLDYLSPRGPLRCAPGNEFVIGYPYTGIVPNLPSPKKLGGEHDYDPARLHTYFAKLLEKPHFGADTYWGGKDILRFGQCALMAQQTGDPDYTNFCSSLQGALTNWFTYESTKKDHFFVYYPHWKGLVGINPSYGSDSFNDHHFHFGYFTFATALLAMHDRQFAADYGEMARLVAKDYANWDRTDSRFPFLRTFDIWAGHSWAGGTASPGGNNQESSSEAVQSWAGLVYLGTALGDKEMTAAGILGYAMETQATLEYWFNASGTVFPPEWKHAVTGMVWSGGKVYGTYFTGDPAWIYGIQWLPASPMLSYLVRDRIFARQCYANMTKDFEVHEQAEAAKPVKPGKNPHVARPATIKNFGTGLGSVMLGYGLMYDPAWAAEQLDTLWNEPGDKIAHSAAEMTIMYYLAHSMRALGRVDWTCHTSSPTSMVYINDATHTRTYIVWNPSLAPQTVAVYESGKVIGKILAAPQSLTSVNKL